MMEIYYDPVRPTDMLHAMSRCFGSRVTDDVLVIPSHAGVGHIKADHLPNGMVLLTADLKFREDIMFHQASGGNGDHQLVLQFTEAVETPGMYVTPRTEAFNMMKHMVLMTNTAVPTRFFAPANARLLVYQLIFNRGYLQSFIDEHVLDGLLAGYFAGIVQGDGIEPLDVEYRTLLKEITRDAITHPLQVNFIQNRAMLLIEKFLARQMAPQHAQPDRIRFNDNEVVRLMKIESMLVNDFSVTPPNITYLSRISAMSPTKLKSDFKKLYGMPIYEYYQKNRMQRAKALLLEGKLSIKEVGVKVGYTNLSHFAGSFRKEFGLLPSALLSKDGAIAM